MTPTLSPPLSHKVPGACTEQLPSAAPGVLATMVLEAERLKQEELCKLEASLGHRGRLGLENKQ